jgi:hypothetical protein
MQGGIHCWLGQINLLRGGHITNSLAADRLIKVEESPTHLEHRCDCGDISRTRYSQKWQFRTLCPSRGQRITNKLHSFWLTAVQIWFDSEHHRVEGRGITAAATYYYWWEIYSSNSEQLLIEISCSKILRKHFGKILVTISRQVPYILMVCRWSNSC